MPRCENVDILLVEDAASDALLLRHALDGVQLPYTLRVLHKGDDVLPWLNTELAKGPHHLPDVIMLDLGLPCLDGFEVLSELASDASFRAIPIVILTGYEHFEYVRSNYNLSFPAYLNKPCDSAKLQDVLTRIGQGKFSDRESALVGLA